MQRRRERRQTPLQRDDPLLQTLEGLAQVSVKSSFPVRSISGVVEGGGRLGFWNLPIRSCRKLVAVVLDCNCLLYYLDAVLVDLRFLAYWLPSIAGILVLEEAHFLYQSLKTFK